MILIKTLTGATALWGAAALAQADTFADRWPAPVAVDPVVAQAESAPIRKARNHHRRALACHRVYYTKNKYRYWRCKR